MWGEPVAGAGSPTNPHPPLVFSVLSWPQVVMKVVQLLPDGHRVKKEVDAALDTVSETMTPMHYHLREIIICTYRQVSLVPTQVSHPQCTASLGLTGCEAAGAPVAPSSVLLLLPLLEVTCEMETRPAPAHPGLIWGVLGEVCVSGMIRAFDNCGSPGTGQGCGLSEPAPHPDPCGARC